MAFKTEQEFENALVNILVTQKGWNGGVLKNPTEQQLLDNWANILYRMNNETDRLNGVPLNQEEMNQLIQQINSLKTSLLKNEFINGQSISIKRENPADTLHYGKEVSLKLFDKREVAGGDSNYQIAQQPIFIGEDKIKRDNRGDVMLLINGMPVIHIELKRDGVPVSNAVNQIQRYIHNGVFSTGIFSLIQIYSAMTPTGMRYFANPGTNPASKINPNYVFQWADFKNIPINDWKTVADRFLSIPMAHQLIGYYTVADKADDVLKVLRSYQINAVKEILDRTQQIRWHERSQLGGYVWHTTGSGKTMTSFKAAELIASYNIADKVIFLMDRIELGTQTLSEFRSFADFEDEVQGTKDTIELFNKLKSEKGSERLIVTSIQKMSMIHKESFGEAAIAKVRNKRMVIIIDEAHRSTFGEMLITIKETFPDTIFFGFTGTPRHEENMINDSTTATIFGNELHRYDLADGIRDKNVLGFDVTQVSTIDYKDLREQVALHKAKAGDAAEALKDPEKRDVYNHYMDHRKFPMLGFKDEETGKYTEGLETNYVHTSDFRTTKHREKVINDIIENWVNLSQGSTYSALLTTGSRTEAIEYYRLLKNNPLGIKLTALFDPHIDESEDSIFIEDGLAEIIRDYNDIFDKTYNITTHALFKKDLSQRLAQKGAYRNLADDGVIHLVIVVQQLLTGYDSKWINTLYVDRVMEYADIIQAFSRTNRLNGDSKPFGSIRYYRFIYTMEENIKLAVEAYSGGREVALFVDKLGGNLYMLNRITEDIESLFSVYNIQNFERLPDDQEARKKFAQLFEAFAQCLEAARIQGFSWEQNEYLTEIVPNQGESKVTITFTKDMFDIWMLRYQELASYIGGGGGGSEGPDEAPFDVNYTLAEKGVGRIDYDYLNNNFKKYVKSHVEGNKEEQKRIKNDLHRSFAKLTAEQQIYANMVINDLENGDLVVETGKEFIDYINEYKDRSEDKRLTKIVQAFGVNKELLQQMMKLNMTKSNINEFGRFNKLKESADRDLAKNYLESSFNKKMKVYEVNRVVSTTLQDFIFEDGFDLDDYLCNK